MAEKASIEISKDGPYIVKGGVPLSEDAIVRAPDGHHMQYNHVKDYEVEEEYHLCRCGASGHKPFCDGTHKEIGFDGTEVASMEPYLDRADEYPGPAVNLLDDNRCAYARFCHRKDGEVWTLTGEAEGGALEQEAIAGSWHCPTGRLEHHDVKTGEVYEQEFEPSIVILEDVEEGASGPLFVRGGIELISEDGQAYEKRNRYALCRCGASRNKPFCDATHIPAEFSDDSPALNGQTGERDTSFEELPTIK